MRVFLKYVGLLALGCASMQGAGAWAEYRNESEWIVHEMADDLWGDAFYVANGEMPDEGPRIEVREVGEGLFSVLTRFEGGETRVELELDELLWQPEVYTGLYQKYLEELVSEPMDFPEPLIDGSFLREKLLDTLDEPTLDALSRDLGGLWCENPTSAARNSEAALLLGTVGTMEAAGRFMDYRPWLNRMCAYLAVATAQGATVANNPDYALAQIELYILAGRQDLADALLESLLGTHEIEGMEAWYRGLSMRNRADWRVLESPEDATALEQFYYFRALCDSAMIPQAALLLAEVIEDPDLPCWSRVVNDMHSQSVGEGHVFAKGGTAQEIQSIGVFLMSRTGVEPAQFAEIPDYIMALQESEAESFFEPGIITDAMWGGWFERHWMNRINEEYYFLDKRWGVPDYARELAGFVRENLAGLPLYPLIERRLAGSKNQLRGAVAGALVMVEKSPERINVYQWSKIQESAKGLKQSLGEKNFGKWFPEEFPMGTAYGARLRVYYYSNPNESSLTPRGVLLDYSPYEFDVAKEFWKAELGGENTPEAILEAFGVTVDYNRYAMIRYARSLENAPEAYEAKMRLLAELDGGAYLETAEYFLARGDEEKAKEYFELFYENSSDRVHVSNSMGWLVNFYLENGNESRALEIAKDGADVYSSRGLNIYGDLLSNLGRWEEAVEVGGMIDERYGRGEGTLRLAYILRASLLADPAEREEWTRRWESESKSIFPQGLSEIDVDTLAGEPTDGVRFSRSNKALRDAGFSPGDVVVGMAGYRVRSISEYVFVRKVFSTEYMSFIVWDGSDYKTIEAFVPQKHFGVGLENYTR